MECCCSLRKCPRPLGRWENAYERRFGEPFKGTVILSERRLNIIRLHRMIRREFINLARSYYQESLLVFELVAWENLERRYFDRRRGRFGKLDATDFYPRRIIAEAHKKWWIRADGTATLLAGSCEPRTHSGAGTDREGRSNRWRWSPCRHLVDPRWLQLSSSQWTSSFNSTYRKKKHSFFWEYIDVTRSTHTDLDVLQEKTIDDYWNVDSNRSLSDSWTGFSKFTLLKEKTLHKDTCGPEGDWQKFTRRPNPDYGQEVKTRIGNATQNREKTRIGKRETGARQCSKNEKNLLYWSRCQRIFGNSSNVRRKLERPITK